MSESQVSSSSRKAIDEILQHLDMLISVATKSGYIRQLKRVKTVFADIILVIADEIDSEWGDDFTSDFLRKHAEEIKNHECG